MYVTANALLWPLFCHAVADVGKPADQLKSLIHTTSYYCGISANAMLPRTNQCRGHGNIPVLMIDTTIGVIRTHQTQSWFDRFFFFCNVVLSLAAYERSYRLVVNVLLAPRTSMSFDGDEKLDRSRRVSDQSKLFEDSPLGCLSPDFPCRWKKQKYISHLWYVSYTPGNTFDDNDQHMCWLHTRIWYPGHVELIPGMHCRSVYGITL